jgi:NAD(P)-dependent dehydrogenase (short-subunit alcohol dehydrogenase family)
MEPMKTILITGAASGIGRETARLFCARGWRVAAADVNAEAMARLSAELDAGLVPIVGDVRTREGARAIVDAATATTGGRLDCLFNCAGVLEMGPHVNIPAERIDRLIDVNAKGVVHCIDAAYSALARTPGAHIVTMSSASAEYGMPDLAMYSASKFFVRGLTEALNIEFEPAGIQVSAILVSYVQTPMVDDAEIKASQLESPGVKVKPAVRVKPETVAEAVWKAAHGDKVLWRVGGDAIALNMIVRVLGSSARGVYKKLTGY